MSCAAGDVEDGCVGGASEWSLLVGGQSVCDNALLLGRAWLYVRQCCFSTFAGLDGLGAKGLGGREGAYRNHPMILGICQLVSLFPAQRRLSRSCTGRNKRYVLSGLGVRVRVGSEDPGRLHTQSSSRPHGDRSVQGVAELERTSERLQ